MTAFENPGAKRTAKKLGGSRGPWHAEMRDSPEDVEDEGNGLARSTEKQDRYPSSRYLSDGNMMET
jgi:hypothetical protein